MQDLAVLRSIDMPYIVRIEDARAEYPNYKFLAPLTPSEQKAAFHVQDADGRNLCLKIIAPNYQMDRLQREIQALQSINHPNVVKLIEYTFSSRAGSHRHYMIEEFIEGDDLSVTLSRGRAWDRNEVVDVFAQILDGLSELDACNIVHRDLKPSNIRIRPNGHPVIIDFGLARHLGLPDITRTGDGAAIGTPKYFAPEQFNGTKYDIDHRTDIFAVGVLIYEALVGQHPFWQPGMSMPQLSDTVCNSNEYQHAPAFSRLPDRWKLIMTRMLDKTRAERPRNAAQAAALLRKIRGD